MKLGRDKKEIIKYKRKEDINEAKRNLVEVYEAMTRAENFLYPSDYKLDKLMYKLLENEDKENLGIVPSYKEFVEVLTTFDAKETNEYFHEESPRAPLEVKAKVDNLDMSPLKTEEPHKIESFERLNDTALEAEIVEKAPSVAATSPDVAETKDNKSY